MKEGGNYISKSVTIKCRARLCQEEILRKNYKRQNPNLDCEDLTTFGQTKISDIFEKKMPEKRRHQSGEVGFRREWR